jgi:hypothetical protein
MTVIPYSVFQKVDVYPLDEKVRMKIDKIMSTVVIPTSLNSNTSNATEGSGGASGSGRGGRRDGHGDDGRTRVVRGNSGIGSRAISTGVNGGGTEKWQREPVVEMPPVKKIEPKQGVEKGIQDIRIAFNKLTSKNYIKQRDEVLSKMRGLRDDDGCSEDEWRRVAQILFDIASTNKFFSALYAQIFLELMAEFPVLSQILDGFLDTFVSNIQAIVVVNPEVDYDAYCAYVKKQDSRKAMAGFIGHLAVGIWVGAKSEDADTKVGEELCDKWTGKISDILQEILSRVDSKTDDADAVPEVEELAEILFIIMGILVGGTDSARWKSVKEQFVRLGGMKVKEHRGLSSRAVFKFMDIAKMFVC